MNQALQIRIDADIDNLEKNINRAKRDLDKFEASVRKQKGGLSGFEKSTNSAATSAGKFGKQINTNAVPAMTSFSQVIQDAPYGIQGVANNITQLTSQMGYLAKGAGGFNGALKAMGGVLLGPAGILLAVSLVTSAMVTYGDKLFSAADDTKKLKEETEKAAEALEEYVDSLDAIARSRIRGEQSAQKELVNLRLLNTQVQDVNKTQKERKDALENLKKLYPSYLTNMSDEEILANGLGTAYDTLTESILKKARAQAAADIIVENEKKKLALQSQLAAKQTEINAQTIKQAKAETAAIDALSSSYKENGTAVVQSNAGNQAEKTTELLEEQKKLIGQIQSIELDNIDLIAGIEDVSLDTADAKVKGGKSLKVDLPVDLDPHNTDILELENDTAEITSFVDHFLDEDERLREALGAAQYDFRLNEAWQDEIANIDQTQADWLARQELFAQQQQQIMGVINSGVSSALNSIAQDLEDGKLSFESFAKSLSQIVLKIVATLLAQSIANAIAGASTAATATGPAAPFVLPGLVGGATAVVAGAFSSLPAFASGGVVPGSNFSGDQVLARLNSGELVLNKMQQEQMKGMMTPSMQLNNQAMEIYGETRIEGDAIVVAYKRAEAKNSRYS